MADDNNDEVVNDLQNGNQVTVVMVPIFSVLMIDPFWFLKLFQPQK